MCSFAFTVKFVFVSGISAKNIYVTQDVLGREYKDCGSHIFPCKTIEYAIKISAPFDIILIDGGKEKRYEYILNKTVLIEKELILTSIKFRHNPRITVKNDLYRKNPFAFFSISKNFTLTAIDVYGNNKKLIFPGIPLLATKTHNISVTFL